MCVCVRMCVFGQEISALIPPGVNCRRLSMILTFTKCPALTSIFCKYNHRFCSYNLFIYFYFIIFFNEIVYLQ